MGEAGESGSEGLLACLSSRSSSVVASGKWNGRGDWGNWLNREEEYGELRKPEVYLRGMKVVSREREKEGQLFTMHIRYLLWCGVTCCNGRGWTCDWRPRLRCCWWSCETSRQPSVGTQRGETGIGGGWGSRGGARDGRGGRGEKESCY